MGPVKATVMIKNDSAVATETRSQHQRCETVQGKKKGNQGNYTSPFWIIKECCQSLKAFSPNGTRDVAVKVIGQGDHEGLEWTWKASLNITMDLFELRYANLSGGKQAEYSKAIFYTKWIIPWMGVLLLLLGTHSSSRFNPADQWAYACKSSFLPLDSNMSLSCSVLWLVWHSLVSDKQVCWLLDSNLKWKNMANNAHEKQFRGCGVSRHPGMKECI